MKTQILYVLVLGFLLAACQKPTEVQITEEAAYDVTNVTDPDPSVDRAGVDSSGLLPRDQENFSGFMTVASVKYSDGTGIVSRSYAQVFFENRLNPIFAGGRKGFSLLPLGILRVTTGLSTDFLIPRERRIGNVSLGFEYVKELTSYHPGESYQFASLGSDSIPAFSTSVEAPEDMMVYSPVGGQRIGRDRDLDLQWSGQGNLFLIISARDAQGRLTPVLNIRPHRNDGRALLTRKLLNALPRRTYVFSFGLSNRNENFTVGRFRGKVLVRGLSIYNVQVELI